MTCDRCPHLREIRNALKPCADCDAGRLPGTVHLDAAADPHLVLSRALPTDHTPQTGVTALDPATEDALRIALSTVFAFDQVEILLLRHILAGGAYASFNRPLRDLAERLAKYDLADNAPGFRQLAKSWADRMVRTMPALEAVFQARIAESAGISRPPRF